MFMVRMTHPTFDFLLPIGVIPSEGFRIRGISMIHTGLHRGRSEISPLQPAKARASSRNDGLLRMVTKGECFRSFFYGTVWQVSFRMRVVAWVTLTRWARR